MACHSQGQPLVSRHRRCLPLAGSCWHCHPHGGGSSSSSSSCCEPTWQTCLAAWPGLGAHPPQPHPEQSLPGPRQLPARAPLPAAAAPALQPAGPPAAAAAAWPAAAGLPLRPLRPLLHPPAAAPSAPLAAAPAAAAPAAPATAAATGLLHRQHQSVWQHQHRGLRRYAQYQSLPLQQGPLQQCQTLQRLRCRLHPALLCPPPPLAGCRGGQARHLHHPARVPAGRNGRQGLGFAVREEGRPPQPRNSCCGAGGTRRRDSVLHKVHSPLPRHPTATVSTGTTAYYCTAASAQEQHHLPWVGSGHLVSLLATIAAGRQASFPLALGASFSVDGTRDEQAHGPNVEGAAHPPRRVFWHCRCPAGSCRCGCRFFDCSQAQIPCLSKVPAASLLATLC